MEKIESYIMVKCLLHGCIILCVLWFIYIYIYIYIFFLINKYDIYIYIYIYIYKGVSQIGSSSMN
jgi:hypothetical protein